MVRYDDKGAKYDNSRRGSENRYLPTCEPVVDIKKVPAGMLHYIYWPLLIVYCLVNICYISDIKCVDIHI